MGDEVITAAIRFDILTRAWNDEKREWEPAALKAFRDPDGRMRLNGIASSTIKDLHGDNMLLSALEDMERAANSGLTIFGNHSYNVPEDVFGMTENAVLKQAGTVDKNGDPIYDLRFGVLINEENDRAVKTWKAIYGKDGTQGAKLGLSIGAMIPEGGAIRDKKSGALTISHVELLETSIVGIPANPRSWIENAVKSFNSPKKSATTVPIGQPQLTLDSDAGTYTIEGRLDGINLGIEDVETNTFTAPEVMEQSDLPAVIDAVEAPDGEILSDLSLDVDPEVTDSRVRIIEIDTGDDSGGSSSQEASSSEPAPESQDSDETGSEDVIASADEILTSAESVIASLDPETTSMFQQLLELTNSLNRELVASAEREEALVAALALAEKQRDEIAVLASQSIEGTNAILNKLADQPVGRRTVFREVKNQFDDLEGIYSREFLNMMRSK